MTSSQNITIFQILINKMNSSSNIQISQSSLLSLKAEVLRKQQEVNKAKILQKQQQQTQTLLRVKTKKNSDSEKHEPHNKGIEDRQANDEIEDEDLLEKSKRMLESKARLYSRLVKGPSNLSEEELERNKHYLVQFDRKDKEETKESSDDEEHFSDEYEPAGNPDEEWVEYTDCLGRTRKCLRKDLEYLKEKDFELSKTLDPEGKQLSSDPPKWIIDAQGSKPPETNEKETEKVTETIAESSELLSSDMRRELLRQEWEKQEQELLDKNDIHYQDVLFNEARSHGVGYYAFSKDAEERAKQQEELRKLREETNKKQNTTLEQKALREQQLAARLKAARNRKRTRMGLPPEEDVPEEPTPTEEQIETEEEKLQKATQAAEEKAKENARRRQVRPWDIGKEGVGKKHYEYSQEEWVDKKRKERQSEFAPPTLYREEKKKPREEEVDNYTEPEKSLFFTTKKSKEKPQKQFYVDTSVPPPNFKSSTSSINPYRDDLEDYNIQQKIFIPTPMVDIDSDEEQQLIIEEERKRNKRKGAKIAPPPTFDYYGPNSSKNKKSTETSANLEDSITAGLRYLREQAEKRERNAERRNLDNT